MNRFLKTNSPWLGLLGLALIVILLAFLFRPQAPHYHISAEETLKLMNDQSLQVTVQSISGKQIIDIRVAELFAQGHPENAINIPIGQLLDEASIELFRQFNETGKAVVLCGTDELQATAPWLLLQQLGYRNIARLKGGYIADGGLVETALSATEASILDTAAFRNKTDLVKTPVQIIRKKSAESVLPVRKEVTSGGGC